MKKTINESTDEFLKDRELTTDQAEVLDTALSQQPAQIKTRKLPSRTPEEKIAEKTEGRDLWISPDNF